MAMEKLTQPQGLESLKGSLKTQQESSKTLQFDYEKEEELADQLSMTPEMQALFNRVAQRQ